MSEKKMVKELMLPVTDYPIVYDIDNIKDAILAMKQFIAAGRKYRSALVFSKTKKVNSEEQLVGILTVRDILNCIKNKTLSYDGPEVFGMSWARFYHKAPLKEPLVTKVGDIVRPLVRAYIQSDQNVTDAIRLMMTKNVNIIPVFDGKKAVGIIRAVDLLDYIGDMCD